MNLELANRLENDIDDALGRGDLDQAEALAQEYRAGAGASLLFRARWLSAQVALSAGRLEEAQARLQELQPPPHDLPPALLLRVRLAMAEVQARLGRNAEARQALEEAKRCAPEWTTNPFLQLRYLRIRLLLGDIEAVAEPLAACRQALEAREDLVNLAILLCEEGRAWDARDRLDRARACWRRAEEISRSPGEDPIRADVLIQLGRLDHLHGHLQSALDRYDQACAGTPVRAQQYEARLRRLLVLLDLNQWTQARTDLDRLEHAWRRFPPTEELAPLARMARALIRRGPEGTYDETAAYRAALRGEVREARALYQQAMSETSAPVRRARIALALGMLAHAAKDVAEARRWLATAEQLARDQDLPEVLWRALQARGQLLGEIGDDDRARELFEQAVLVSERQSRTLRHRVDAVTHGMRRGAVLRALLQAACRRGDAAAVFRYQELERGRLLLELWRAAPPSARHRRLADDPHLSQVDQLLAEAERDLAGGGADVPSLHDRREELLLTRDRLLDEYLRDRSRVAGSALPSLPKLSDLERALKPDTLYLAPAIVNDELYVLTSRAGGPSRVVQAPGSATEVVQRIEQVRRCLDEQLSKYRHGFSPGIAERKELDATLADFGSSGLGDVLGRLLDEAGARITRILWVPDDALHGLPLAALRRGGRYLVETHEVSGAFGGAHVVHQARTRARSSWIRRGLVVSESTSVLPAAPREGEGVAATFGRRTVLHGASATRAALRRHLPRASVAHFACHAYFDDRHALSASIGLPSGEIWRALEFFDEPIDGLPLVTLSACRSAEVGLLAGKEVFGPVTGLLAAGVRAVVAGLWPIADREALPFMWRFYRNLLLHDTCTALALAQREALAQHESSPLYWAAFVLFGDAGSLPGPGRWTRWLARRRRRRHERLFPLPDMPKSMGV